MNDLDVIVSAWRRLASSGIVDFTKMDVYRAPPPLNVSTWLNDAGAEIVDEKVDIVEFYQVRECLNGEPIRMTHGRYKGKVANLSMNPPRMIQEEQE